MNARRLVCLIAAHRYRKVHHPDSDAPGEYFLRCERCDYRRDVPDQPPDYAWTYGF